MDRHLLPEEIDLLLDGEVGFGTPPLKAHIRRCAACRGELEDARVLADAMERLPRFAPSPLFAERVMSRVQVFVPWHAALADTARGWMPRSRAARGAALVGAGGVAVVLMVATLWIVTRLDAVLFAVNLGLTHLRSAALGMVSDAVSALFGEPVLRALHASGPLGVTVALLAFLLTVAAAARALRALTANARQR